MRHLRWYGVAGVIVGGILFPVAVAWACLPVASLTSNTAQAQPGSQVTVTGSEFGSNPVDVHFNALTGPVLATLTPDSNGNFSGAVTIPSDAAPGSAVLVATEAAATAKGPKGSSPGVPARALIQVVGPGGAPLAPAGPVAGARPVSPLTTSSVGVGTLALVALGVLGAQQQQLGRKPGDVLGSEIADADNQRPHQVFRAIMGDLGTRPHRPIRADVHPYLVGRLPRLRKRLDFEDSPDANIEAVEAIVFRQGFECRQMTSPGPLPRMSAAAAAAPGADRTAFGFDIILTPEDHERSNEFGAGHAG